MLKYNAIKMLNTPVRKLFIPARVLLTYTYYTFLKRCFFDKLLHPQDNFDFSLTFKLSQKYNLQIRGHIFTFI